MHTVRRTHTYRNMLRVCVCGQYLAVTTFLNTGDKSWDSTVRPAGSSTPTRVLRGVQGTVILHISTAAKHDPLLCKDLVCVCVFGGCM